MRSALLSFVLALGVGAVNSFRGAPDEFYERVRSRSVYCPDVNDASKSILVSEELVNDDYCDCADGIDEPGTPACSNGRFLCGLDGPQGRLINSSWVDDGVCDCCDGRDEYSGKVTCADRCHALRGEQVAAYRKQVEMISTGLARKAELEAEGRKLAKAQAVELFNIDSQLTLLSLENKDLEQMRQALDRVKKLIPEDYKEQGQTLTNQPGPAGSSHAPKENAKTKTRGSSDDVDYDEDDADNYRDDEDDYEDEDEHEHEYHDDDSYDDTDEYEYEEYEEYEEDDEYDEHHKDTAQLVTDIRGDENLEGSKTGDEQGGSQVTEETSTHADEDQSEEALMRSCQDLYDEEKLKSLADQFERIFSRLKMTPLVRRIVGDPKVDHASIALLRKCSTFVDSKMKRLATERSKLEREKRDLQTRMPSAAASDAFKGLAKKSFKTTIHQYTYELVVFGAVKQFEEGRMIGSLGSWTGGLGVRQKYENGATCWQGPKRSTSVEFVCSADDVILDVQEPERCVYKMIVGSPVACEDGDLDHYQKLLKDLGEDLDEKDEL